MLGGRVPLESLGVDVPGEGGREGGSDHTFFKYTCTPEHNYMYMYIHKHACMHTVPHTPLEATQWVMLTHTRTHTHTHTHTHPHIHTRTHLVTVDTPSTNFVLKSTLALLNMPSFRDTTMNWELWKCLLSIWPMFCVTREKRSVQDVLIVVS